MTWSLVLLSPLARVELESLVTLCGMVWYRWNGRSVEERERAKMILNGRSWELTIDEGTRLDGRMG